MSDISDVFEKGRALIAFLTAGDPSSESTVKYISALARGGADIILLGIPFSDPIAENAAVQDSNIRALKGGVSVEKTFEIVGQVRKNCDIPIILRSYLNPVFRYGYEKFFARCKSLNIGGIEVPDLPLEEKEELQPYARENGVDIISEIAVADRTRVRKIAAEGQGYLMICAQNEERGALALMAAGEVPVVAVAERAEDAMTLPCAGICTGGGAVEKIAMLGEHAEDALAEYAAVMKRALYAR